ncbi:TIGR01777 family oxidoreductase [Aquimarina algicola]|uniref:TIGR01777 family protein n=1 Tax=Aquimarina algicola TaxID=2589995 RepID=A0A504J572_9FLAO|nr:TIGR01777 family oxidoreductase [Aquimarina algicola]TPN81351.1 TIGR01777 family protein [Aquimarina algicola]
MKKIVIAAGTGFLGKVLIQYFQATTDQIIILTRGNQNTKNNIKFVHWDAQNIDTWAKELEETDVLINMTGKSVDCRYTEKNKKLILDSRVNSTIVLGEAVKSCKTPPKVWINSSTATIYRHSLDKEMDEIHGEIGTGFSVNVAKAWEKAFFDQVTPSTRKVAVRTSIVLGKNGGALKPILNLTKIGMGGKQGTGNQKISWIHETDFARSLDFIINNKSIEGAINIVAPKPTTNAIFMKTMREVTKIPFGIPSPKLLLELGARIINTETELVLKSRNVVPKKLEEHGFQFSFSDLKKALQSLV